MPEFPGHLRPVRLASPPGGPAGGDLYFDTALDRLRYWQATAAAWVSLNPTPPLVTSLPASPVDGQEVYFQADATNGIVWRLRYNAGSSSAYKWEFVGGSPLFAEVATEETTASTTYVALATAGPTLTLPRAGDYDVEIGCRLYSSVNNTGALMGYDIGATGAVDADAVSYYAAATLGGGATATGNYARARRKTGLTAVALTAKYRATSAITVAIGSRWMRVTPVRVS